MKFEFQDIFETDFKLIGGRNYVQGLVITEQFIDCLKRALENRRITHRALKINHVKFNREIKGNGLIATGPKENRTYLENFQHKLSAEMMLTVDNHRLFMSLFQDMKKPTLERLPEKTCSYIQDIHMMDNFAGTANLNSVTSVFQILTGIIRVNKKLHAGTLEDRTTENRGIYWAYMKNFPIDQIISEPNDVGLVFKPKGVKNEGELSYTLTEVTVSICESQFVTLICFYYKN